VDGEAGQQLLRTSLYLPRIAYTYLCRDLFDMAISGGHGIFVHNAIQFGYRKTTCQKVQISDLCWVKDAHIFKISHKDLVNGQRENNCPLDVK